MWIGVAVLTLIVVGGVVGFLDSRRGSPREAEEMVASTEIVGADQSEVAEYRPRVLVFETETPGQALVFGPGTELDVFGAELSRVHRERCHATQSSALGCHLRDGGNTAHEVAGDRLHAFKFN